MSVPVRRRPGVDDLLYVLDENPPEELREKVMAAARTCPKNAISIED